MWSIRLEEGGGGRLTDLVNHIPCYYQNKDYILYLGLYFPISMFLKQEMVTKSRSIGIKWYECNIKIKLAINGHIIFFLTHSLFNDIRVWICVLRLYSQDHQKNCRTTRFSELVVLWTTAQKSLCQTLYSTNPLTTQMMHIVENGLHAKITLVTICW